MDSTALDDVFELRAAGEKCTTLTLSGEDYARFLDKKLYEEFQEYQDCKCLE